MKKDVGLKSVACSNGHTGTPNGRGDDEGGGGNTIGARVSYAAAARKPPSPQLNNTTAPFPLTTGFLLF